DAGGGGGHRLGARGAHTGVGAADDAGAEAVAPSPLPSAAPLPLARPFPSHVVISPRASPFPRASHFSRVVISLARRRFLVRRISRASSFPSRVAVSLVAPFAARRAANAGGMGVALRSHRRGNLRRARRLTIKSGRAERRLRRGVRTRE